MQVIKIYPSGFASNCYILTEDGKTGIAIDPAQPRILQIAKKRGIQIEYAILTHGHFDHIGGCAALAGAGAKIGCSKREEALVKSKDNLAEIHGGAVPPFSVDFTFGDGETLSLCGMQIKVIATPGHTAGGVCYLIDGSLFTGDTLFCGSVGRTDLPTGSAQELIKSVKKLYALAGDHPVYAGHGEDTSLEYERKYNAFVR